MADQLLDPQNLAPNVPTHATLCAGLPYVGERPFSDDERSRLRREARLTTAAGCLLPVGATILLIGLAMLVVSFLPRTPETLVTLSLVVLFLLTMVLIALAIVVGRDLERRGAKLRKTRKIGYVRRFEGPPGWFDPTDRSLHVLLKANLLQNPVNGLCVVELLPHLNLAYSVNGVRLKKDVPLGITSAAVRPADAPAYDVPKSWLSDNAPPGLERRRPSPEELDELKGYSRPSRRFWFMAATRFVLVAVCTCYLLSILSAPILLAWQRYTGLRIDPALLPPVAIVLGLAVAIWRIGLQVYRVVNMAQRVKKEIELGWIIAVPTFGPPLPGSTEPQRGPVIERLPVTNLLWTIGGKPAGWRRNVKAIKKGL